MILTPFDYWVWLGMLWLEQARPVAPLQEPNGMQWPTRDGGKTVDDKVYDRDGNFVRRVFQDD